MPADEFAKLGLKTDEQQRSKYFRGREKELHNQLSNWLRRNEFEDYYHSDFTKPATIARGLPDYGIFLNSRIIFGEFKVFPNGLSEIQQTVFTRMIARGNVVQIWLDYETAVESIEKFFEL